MRFRDFDYDTNEIINKLCAIENISISKGGGLVSFAFNDEGLKGIDISDDFDDFEDFISKMNSLDYTFFDTLSTQNKLQWQRLISHFEDISNIIGFDDDEIMYDVYLQTITVKLDKLMQELEPYEYMDQDNGDMINYTKDCLKNDVSSVLSTLQEYDVEDIELKKDIEAMITKIKLGAELKIFFDKGILKNDFVVENGVLVKYIGNDEVVNVPDGIITVDEECFFELDCLKQVILPPSTQVIGKAAFARCKNLEMFSLQGGITTIEKYTFYACENLKHLFIPSSVNKIEEQALEECHKLTIICAEDSYAAEYAEENGIPYIEVPEDEFQAVLTQEDIEEYIEQYQKEKEGLTL